MAGRPGGAAPLRSLEWGVLRAEKHDVVDELRGVFTQAGAVVVTHYQGLTVAQMTELRRGMREAGARFRVTKNRLTRLALTDTPYAPLAEMFTGPTAIAYASDPVAAAKATVGFAKRNERLAVVGGGIGEHLLTAEQVRALADLPTLDELRAGLVGLISRPAARMVGVLQAPGGQVARVLAAHAEQARD